MYKNLIRLIAKRMGIEVFRLGTLEKRLNNSNKFHNEDVEILLSLCLENPENVKKYWCMSKAQIRQDLFVLTELNFKRNGFFVDFGATNGFDLSNSWLLEKFFDWKGILAEPAKSWHPQLKKNRDSHIESKCVWNASGIYLDFVETVTKEYSTIMDFSNNDHLGHERFKYNQYKVETISLLDLLRKYDAPAQIDYLSIDTEGSEYEILKGFDFTRYDIRVITCEHNYTDSREKIYNLLSEHGYMRKYKNLSQMDDWYVKTA